MLEVEMKFPVADKASLLTRLKKMLRADQPPEARAEIDHYFNAPDRDFGKTDEALRVRQIGDINVITYKGPKLDAQTKTRKELEVRLANGPAAAEQFGEMLRALRYRPTATLHKERVIHHLTWGGFPVEACVDEARDLGTFVELEIVARPEDLDAARNAVMDLARELGLGQSERRSYLEMWLQKHANREAGSGP